MKDFLVSILLGMLPECLFYTFFWVSLKRIDSKKKILFGLIFIIYFILIMIRKYEVLYYFLFGLLIYFVLKILYKEKINFLDIFVFYLACAYVFFISCICIAFVPKYEIALMINRILLFVPFVFKKQLMHIYQKYMYIWNKETNNSKKIKSITLRVTTILLFIGFIIISSKVCLYIYNMKGG